MADVFLGLRGTGSWIDNARPENWREGILYLEPNGMARLTGMLSKLRTEVTDDPVFHWFTKTLDTQKGTVTGVYRTSDLGTAYDTPATYGTAGKTVYFKMSQEHASKFRVGHQALARRTTDPDLDCNGKVIDVTLAGANSYVAVRLLEADDNSSTSNLANADVLLVNGNINPEAGERPQALSRDPVEHSNYTQIFRTPLEISRTAMKTRMRTGDAYNDLKKECLLYHGIEMEKAWFWGVKTSGTGANGQPERTTQGLVPAIKAGGNSFNYVTDAAYASKTWLQGGEDWLNAKLEVLFRYGAKDKVGFCGNGVVLAINQLVKAGSDYNITAGTAEYGIKVLQWMTPFGTLNLMTHPLFNLEETARNTLVTVELSNLRYRPLKDSDTQFYEDPRKNKQSTESGLDGIREEYLTEAGLEYHHPETMGYFVGFGSTNTAS